MVVIQYTITLIQALQQQSHIEHQDHRVFQLPFARVCGAWWCRKRFCICWNTGDNYYGNCQSSTSSRFKKNSQKTQLLPLWRLPPFASSLYELTCLSSRFIGSWDITLIRFPLDANKPSSFNVRNWLLQNVQCFWKCQLDAHKEQNEPMCYIQRNQHLLSGK